MLSDDEKKQVIAFTKRVYPYNYAYLNVFNECCRVKEEVGIHNFLKDEGLKKELSFRCRNVQKNSKSDKKSVYRPFD